MGAGVISQRPCPLRSVASRQSLPLWFQPTLPPLSVSSAAGSTSDEARLPVKVLGERDGLAEVEIPTSWSLFGAVGQGVTLAMLALVDSFMMGMHKLVDAGHPDTLGNKAVVTALRSGRYDTELLAALMLLRCCD